MFNVHLLMRVLIACEYSGTVRDAFIAKGHYAMSCDLLATDKDGPHYQGDVFDIINNGWDLMIAHPPCTYLSNAGVGYLNIERYGEKARERMRLRELGKDFFMALYNAPINKICVENPIGWMNGFIKPSQIIQPYYFGDAHMKTTCLWLKGLPRLQHAKHTDLFTERTHVGVKPVYIDKMGKKRYFTDAINGSKKTAQKERSKSFQGIANAMANQWG